MSVIYLFLVFLFSQYFEVGAHLEVFFSLHTQRGGFGAGKSRSAERNMVRRIPNRRNGRPQENGGPKNKRARRSTSDQEEDSNSEDEEREATVISEKNKKMNGDMEALANVKQEEDLSEQNKPRDAENRTALTNGVKVEKDGEHHEDRCHVSGEVKKEAVELEESETKPYPHPAKPCTEPPAELSVQAEQVAESNGEMDQKPNVQSGSSQPAVDVPPPQPVKRTC